MIFFTIITDIKPTASFGNVIFAYGEKVSFIIKESGSDLP